MGPAHASKIIVRVRRVHAILNVANLFRPGRSRHVIFRDQSGRRGLDENGHPGANAAHEIVRIIGIDKVSHPTPRRRRNVPTASGWHQHISRGRLEPDRNVAELHEVQFVICSPARPQSQFVSSLHGNRNRHTNIQGTISWCFSHIVASSNVVHTYHATKRRVCSLKTQHIKSKGSSAAFSNETRSDLLSVSKDACCAFERTALDTAFVCVGGERAFLLEVPPGTFTLNTPSKKAPYVVAFTMVNTGSYPRARHAQHALAGSMPSAFV